MNPFSKKLVKLNEAVAKVNAEIKTLEHNVSVIDKVFSILATFEGKQINARIETALKKELKGAVTFYEKSSSVYRLSLWGYAGLDYNSRMQFTLGYVNEDDTLTMARIRSLNTRYVLEVDRIKNLETVLPKLNDLCDMYNEIIIKIDSFQTVRDAMYQEMDCSATPSYLIQQIFPL